MFMTKEAILAIIMLTPHDCGSIELPPSQHDRIPEDIPSVWLMTNFWNVDAKCKHLGVRSPISGSYRFYGCTTSTHRVIMPLRDNVELTYAQWDCMLYHEVRGHVGGRWPFWHPGARYSD